jgi:hypothetical protein
MPLHDLLRSLAVALLVLGAGAVFLSHLPSWSDRSEILWAVAIVSMTTALIYLVAVLALQ